VSTSWKDPPLPAQQLEKSDGNDEKMDIINPTSAESIPSGGGSTSSVTSSSDHQVQSSKLGDQIRTGVWTVETLDAVSLYLSSRFKNIGGLLPICIDGQPPTYVDISDKSKTRVLQFCQGTSLVLFQVFFSPFCVVQ
jgi:hypothetical protein